MYAFGKIGNTIFALEIELGKEFVIHIRNEVEKIGRRKIVKPAKNVTPSYFEKIESFTKTAYLFTKILGIIEDVYKFIKPSKM